MEFHVEGIEGIGTDKETSERFAICVLFGDKVDVAIVTFIDDEGNRKVLAMLVALCGV